MGSTVRATGRNHVDTLTLVVSKDRSLGGEMQNSTVEKNLLRVGVLVGIVITLWMLGLLRGPAVVY